jgi:hypothetical protein
MTDDKWVDKPLTPEELVRGSPEHQAYLRNLFKDHRAFWETLLTPEALAEYNREMQESTHEGITPPWEE